MASLTYIKGVRTRFRNYLAQEITRCNEMLQHDQETIDTDMEIAEAAECLKRLTTYHEKVENQTEKYVEALSDEEGTEINSILDEDLKLCDEALTCSYKLDTYIDGLTSDKSKSAEKESEHMEQVLGLQEKMQTFMTEQSKRQQDFVEHQSHRQFEFQEKQQTQQHEIMDKLTSPKDPPASVKLPKLELRSYNGDKLKWSEFWDSFECAVHKNGKLSQIEKFNYLQSKLVGEAKSAISGLSLCNENYNIAVSLLQDRFGKKQDIIDTHYQKMMTIEPPSGKTESLRIFLDTTEKHLRSLEVLGETTDQNMFVSMIKTKIPKDVLLQLEIQKGVESEWKVKGLRERLRAYINAREHAEQSTKGTASYNNDHATGNSSGSSFRRKFPVPQSKQTRSKGPVSAETLVSSEKGKTYVGYTNKCRYCAHPHWSDECTKYKTVAERKSQLQDSCYRCLREGHRTTGCKLSKICVHCGERDAHHRSLCLKKFPAKAHIRQEYAHVSKELQDENKNAEVWQENVLVSSGERVLMQTATTEVKGPSSEKNKRSRLLLDSGSQRTYVTEHLAEQLGLTRGEDQEIKLATFGCNKPKVIRTPTTQLDIKLNNGKHMTITANIVPDITGTIERKAVHLPRSEEIQHILDSLDLADTIPSVNETSEIDILIGNDYYLDIVLPQRFEIQPGLYLLSSKLGWILTGRTYSATETYEDTNMLILTYGSSITEASSFTSVDSVLPRKPDLEDFWTLESIGVTDETKSNEDEDALENFKDTLKFEDGRYQVTWPWKEERPDLPVNRGLAHGRLKSTVARMRDKPELLKQYDAVIQDQVSKGVVEKVNAETTGGVVHYLPHHAVITPLKTTTKMRLVYDASAKTSQKNKSLNECMYRGPVMLHDLCGMLMRFRTHNVAVVADIEKAFLQVGLQPDQRDATRFLWLKDAGNMFTDPNHIQEYRFCRVPFGVISSPFILGATINCHLDTYQSHVAEKLKRDIYVDNIITGTNTDGDALEMYTVSKQMFRDASMNLREWSTNSALVNNIIPPEDRAKSNSVKVLGHLWNTDQDTLSLKEPAEPSVTTKTSKRTVLAQLASVYDPLGLFCPLVLPGKVLMQNLWSKHLEWDDDLDHDDVLTWTQIKEELQKIPGITIPRSIALEGNEHVKFSLLCFCDASSKAYASAIYLHQEGENATRSDLIFAKSRLAPVKQITIPRLELMAVVIGVRCIAFVKDNLDLPIENIYVWSDSQCVLHWIESDNSSQVFVKNRIKEIKSHAVTGFHYIPSSENPADVASRGTTVDKLECQNLWFHGPDWLTQPIRNWQTAEVGEGKNAVEPTDTEQMCEITERPEDISERELSGNKETALEPPFGIESESYSSASRLFRVTAFALRFINKTRKKSSATGALTRQELENAERLWIVHIQRKNYSDVYTASAKKTRNNLQRQLGLYIDDSGVIRCRGRLENSELSEATRHPILLPKNDRVTYLMIDRTHKEVLHSGVSQTLSKVRYRFWIPSGRARVKQALHQCLVCRRNEGGAYKMPMMAPLPKSRVAEAPPFTKVGLDYLGPLYVRGVEGANKVWICLYTCLVTRAVHLELMHNMSTEEFLMGLRRFIASRGKPDEIISDNAMQFKLASETVSIIWQRTLKCSDVQNYASEHGITWTFIVELAPWMGGFYERLVGLVKRALRKVIGRRLLTEVQMQTIIKEVESVVNTRPITYVGDDINSKITLSPASFLSLNPKLGIPEADVDNDDDYLQDESSSEKLFQIWKKGQKILNQFWKVWKDEYLLSLRERSQTRLKSSRIQSHFVPRIGDVVLIKEDIPRGCWKLGRIVDLIVSRDGETRSAKVQTHSGRVIGRPLNLLYPIEVSGTVDQVDKINVSECDTPVSRPKRQAAENAKLNIKRFFDKAE